MKKFVVLLLVVLGIALYWLEMKAPRLDRSYCAFCDSKILEYQKFAEDAHVVALYTHKPMLPGHCLILPKRHVERLEMLSEEEIVHIHRMIQKVDRAATSVFGTSSYLILQKNGSEVGQTVPHVHFHYIPRKENDASTLKFIMKMYLANMKKPISKEEMEMITRQMKEAIESEQKLSLHPEERPLQPLAQIGQF